jgi:hypothetical protein
MICLESKSRVAFLSSSCVNSFRCPYPDMVRNSSTSLGMASAPSDATLRSFGGMVVDALRGGGDSSN